VIGHRRISREIERGEHFCEEEPRAEFRVNEHRALAVPARAGERREVAFEHWARVHVAALQAAARAQPFVDGTQFFSR